LNEDVPASSRWNKAALAQRFQAGCSGEGSTMAADITRAIERRPARHRAAVDERKSGREKSGREKSGRGKSIGTRRRRTVTALAATALTLLVGGCVCRPLHVSETAPATVEDLKASLP
jgi:hypothetical protein